VTQYRQQKITCTHTQVSILSEEMKRAASDRDAAHAAIDRLSRNLQEGTHNMMADQRRAADATGDLNFSATGVLQYVAVRGCANAS